MKISPWVTLFVHTFTFMMKPCVFMKYMIQLCEKLFTEHRFPYHVKHGLTSTKNYLILSEFIKTLLSHHGSQMKHYH
jgi:hypothetical protein